MSKPFIIQTEDLDPRAVSWLAERAELTQIPADVLKISDERIARADGLVVRTYTKVDEALLAKMPKLKVVGRAGVGVDNIDVEACRRRGIAVVNTPDANGDAVAELVFALIFDVIRPRVLVEEAMPLERWNQTRRELVAARQLNELTIGICGLGKIGKRIARIGRAFGARMIYHDVVEIAEAQRQGATPVSREQLLSESDIITVHVDNRAGNQHLFNAAAFAKMKHGVIFVNTSRGFVVDEPALAKFLHDCPAAHAVLDVHDPEPPKASSPLLPLANASLTPHIAAATEHAHQNMSWVVKDVWRVLTGEKPENAAAGN